MPSNTTRLSLPYPAASDAASTVDDTLKSFAEAVDEKLDIRRIPTSGSARAQNLAFYEDAQPNLTGYVIIQTNLTMGNYMMRIDIDGYTYLAMNNIIDISITAYGFQPDNAFYSVDVNNRGSMNFSEIQLMVRNSDGKIAVALKADSPSNYWQYPKMRVGAWVGHTTPTNDMLTGWTITRAANLTGYTVKKAADQSIWRYPALGGGWVNYDNGYTQARYRKIGQMVYLQGLIRSGGFGTVAFNLPEGFRPNSGTLIFLVNCDGTAMGRCDVDVSGNVVPQGGGAGYFSLSGIQFAAER